jgi:hypothetical protein
VPKSNAHKPTDEVEVRNALPVTFQKEKTSAKALEQAREWYRNPRTLHA